jgi:hypothetical protein
MSLSMSILDAATGGGRGNTLRRIPAYQVIYREYRRNDSAPGYVPDASTGKAADCSSVVSFPFPPVSPDLRLATSSRQDVYAAFDRISLMAG